MNGTRSGFTITEVMIAVVILGVGVLALAGGAAAATRMLGQGQRTTNAAAVGAARLERLRRAANATNPRCTNASFASGNGTTNNVTETWTVPTTGIARTVLEVITYRKYNGSITDTLATIVSCAT
ncbi:MAG: prepilin-type N-terminal cleavage/methylation domain-containing protein [Gemmatimonadales bacterium]